MTAILEHPEAKAQRIREAFERYEEILHLGVRNGSITQARADELLLSRALLDSCRIIDLGVTP